MSVTPRKTPIRQAQLKFPVVKRQIEKSPTKELNENANVLDSIENSPRKRKSDDKGLQFHILSAVARLNILEAETSMPVQPDNGSGSKRACSQTKSAVMTPINFYRSSTTAIRTPASELVKIIGTGVTQMGIQTPATLPAVSGSKSARLAVKSRQRLRFECDEAEKGESEHDALNG